jgi:hypothetical protein
LAGAVGVTALIDTGAPRLAIVEQPAVAARPIAAVAIRNAVAAVGCTGEVVERWKAVTR